MSAESSAGMAPLLRLAMPLRGSALIESQRLMTALGNWHTGLLALAEEAIADDVALVRLVRERSRFVDAVDAAQRALAVVGVCHATTISELRARAELTLALVRGVAKEMV